MKSRVLLLLGLSVLLPALGFAGDDDTASPLDALPGYYQFTHDDPLVGTLSAGGYVVSLVAPFVLVSADADQGEYWVERDGQHYFHWTDSTSVSFQDNRWTSALVVSSSLWGSFFSSYGTWNTYVNTRASEPLRRQRGFTMVDYLSAPFDPEQVFNSDVFPLLPLITIGTVGLADYGKMGGFFQKDSVSFAGVRVSPWAGLGLTAASSLAIVAANATLEEILFRGLLLDRYGVAGSSVIFGLNHMLNAFVLPNFSFEEGALQSLSAGLFGWYAADRTRANGGDFRRMIALHFWNNVTALVLNYLIDPENTFLFQISIPIEF